MAPSDPVDNPDRHEPVEPTTDAEVTVDDEVLVEEISIDGMCGVY